MKFWFNHLLKPFLAGIVSAFIVLSLYYYLHLSKNYVSKSELANYLTNQPSYNSLPKEIPLESKIEIKEDISISRQNAITMAVEQVSHGVVGINVTKLSREYLNSPLADDPFLGQFFPPSYRNRNVKSVGSGIIYTDDGYILTNEHVIHNAREIIVTTTEGKEYQAQIVGADQISDVAILKIDVKKHAHIRLGDSEQIIMGEWVIAFGNPYGLFEYSNKPLISVGVVSGLEINFGRSQNKRHFYEKMIQTDAAINPGNSGGPLVNAAGEVIGLNTMIYSEKGGSIGIGFATPINKVKEITKLLHKDGYVNRNINWGFSIANVNSTISQSFQLSAESGVLITGVERGSAADKTGFEIGDLIIGVANVKINNYRDIKAALFEAKDYKVGDVINFTIIRNKKRVMLTMKLVSN